ncbi:hypothetical protein EDB85DRAFT_2161956 [Lactarius pseudohatsudake]|nr:hypothetical protein EDB85DRAFT_2161956 [Lactarius pseudohatsudake]
MTLLGLSSLVTIYVTHAQNLDEENVENWKGVTDRALIFTGLFSATVAVFIAISYPNLLQDPNIVTQFLLAQISQRLSNATVNGASGISNPHECPFGHIFAKMSQPVSPRSSTGSSTSIRAHIREYVARGARRFHIFGLVEALPFLLLVSVHLFFAGLIAFAFRTNHIVAYFTTAIVGFCSGPLIYCSHSITVYL